MRQVLPVEREQIEGEVSGGVAPLYHVGKDASAWMIDHDQLAIQDSAFTSCTNAARKVLMAGELVFLPG